MQGIKTYLSVAPMLTTLWFGSLACLLIDINHLLPDALTFPFFILVIGVVLLIWYKMLANNSKKFSVC